MQDEGTCSTIGKTKDSEICPKFRKNIYAVKGTSQKENSAIEQIGKMLAEIDDSRLGVIGLILLEEQETRRAGFKFYQRVYVRYRGRATQNYLSNFMAAHILHVTKDDVVLCSADGKVQLTYPRNRGGKIDQSIYTVKEFKKLRAQMREEGKFKDPEIKSPAPKNRTPDELEEVRAAVASSKGDVESIDAVYEASKKVSGKKKRKAQEGKKENYRLYLTHFADAMLKGEIGDGVAPDDFDSFSGLGDVDDCDTDSGSDSRLRVTEDENGNSVYEC